MNPTKWTSVLGVVGMASLSACGPDLDANDPFLADIEVSESQSALVGDIRCASTWAKDYIDQMNYPNYCDFVGYQSCRYDTPDDSYGDDYFEYSYELCPQFMTIHTHSGVDASQYPMRAKYWAQFTIADTPRNRTDCERARLEMAAYYGDTNGGAWHLYGTRTTAGVWQNGSCYIQPLSLEKTLTCNYLGQCQRTQAVSARAYLLPTMTYGLYDHKRVKFGIRRVDGQSRGG